MSLQEHFTMRTTLGPAHPEDFDYCARLYFEDIKLKGFEKQRPQVRVVDCLGALPHCYLTSLT
jgi:hypothetical protein